MIKKILKSLYLILGILLIIYVLSCDALMTFSLSMNLCFFTMGILLIMLYYVFSHPIDKEIRGPSFIYIFIKTSSALFFIFFIGLFLFNVFYIKHTLPKGSDYHYIVVFGAGIKKDRNEIINSRLGKAIEYANKYNKSKLVLTGAKGKDEPIEEAFYMKDYMKKAGIEEDRIIVEPFSVNTYENMENSLELIRADIIKRNLKENIIKHPIDISKNNYDLEFLNIGFISSEFHLTRVSMIAKKKGIRKPFVIPCETFWYYRPYVYVRENLSLFKAFVLGELKL